MTGEVDTAALAAAGKQLLAQGWRPQMVPNVLGAAAAAALAWEHDGVVDVLLFTTSGRAALTRAKAEWDPARPHQHGEVLSHALLPTIDALTRALELTLEWRQRERPVQTGEATVRWRPDISDADTPLRP